MPAEYFHILVDNNHSQLLHLWEVLQRFFQCCKLFLMYFRGLLSFAINVAMGTILSSLVTLDCTSVFDLAMIAFSFLNRVVPVCALVYVVIVT